MAFCEKNKTKKSGRLARSEKMRKKDTVTMQGPVREKFRRKRKSETNTVRPP